MKRRLRSRTQQKQINILHTTTRQRHSRTQVTQIGFWAAVVLAMVGLVGVGMHYGINVLLDHVLYHNSRYTLKRIQIEPVDRFDEYNIRRVTGLERGQNLWSLKLPQITRDLEKLPYVSNARVERRFPDTVVIKLHERTPVVKITALNEDAGTRETYYLDRDCIVLEPRPSEQLIPLPEIVGLSNAEVEPGVRLEDPSLVKALKILNAIDNTSTLHTSIDIRSIDLSQPLSIKMVTTRDLTIIFRTDVLDQQLVRLVSIFERYGNDPQRTLHTIDLTPEVYDPITFYQ
jgi:cell division septal protein FtsQ